MGRWSGKRIVVTGGAGFIGTNLVEALFREGADTVKVVDRILVPQAERAWERKISRLSQVYSEAGFQSPNLEVLDLATEPLKFERAIRGFDAVYHLSAVFGGREFVDTRQSDCSAMLAIDHNAIEGAYQAGVPTFAYASSACVYPPKLQEGYGSSYLLQEDTDILAGPFGAWWHRSDNLYGWAKLMGELQCEVYHKEKGMETSACRFLTVYGRGEMDTSHAIAALVERTLDRQDPFVVWGSGRQERGFTYVSDIVRGMMLAAEKVVDGTPVNLGSLERYSIDEVIGLIWSIYGWTPRNVSHDISKPEGPQSRLLDVSRAANLLGWEPRVSLPDGLRETLLWHKELREAEARK